MTIRDFLARFLRSCCLLLLIGLIPASSSTGAAPAIERGATGGEYGEFVGSEVCVSCHRAEAEKWARSHHAQSMQKADRSAVLGDFDNAVFDDGVTNASFTTSRKRFWVETDGASGTRQRYEVKYTFGVYPLQQYLVDFPGGRLQALPIAWDARPRELGGQRWFHLNAGEKVTHIDALHWTKRFYNWNNMCASCHSTNLQKNYDTASNQFDSKWSEVNVACEACHGAGANHVAWTKGGNQRQKLSPEQSRRKGFVADFSNFNAARWQFDGSSAVARKDSADGDGDICFGCHARRTALIEPPEIGAAFSDNYEPALLDERLYHVDGQIKDEVFEYGSFLQSKMHRAGVGCVDCHDAHSLSLHRSGNELCTGCHRKTTFDTPQHHRHEDKMATLCVSCHMPTMTYMGVDVRRDHSFRIPEPHLTTRFGVPNACNACHGDKTAEWAARTTLSWHGSKEASKSAPARLAEALHAARNRADGAVGLLASIVTDSSVSDIARATAIAELAHFSASTADEAILKGVRDESPLVRAAAASASRNLNPKDRLAAVGPLLHDDMRAVRVNAARSLLDVPVEWGADEHLRKAFDAARLELIRTEKASAETPESQLNLANIYLREGETLLAHDALQHAIRLDRNFVPALVNLADLYSQNERLGSADEAESLLRSAIEADPRAAAPVYALAMSRIRKGDRREGVKLLAKAVELAPDVARYSYVYGLALVEQNRLDEAASVLERAYSFAPNDRTLLTALAKLANKRGDKEAAHLYLERIARLRPVDGRPAGAGTGRALE